MSDVPRHIVTCSEPERNIPRTVNRCDLTINCQDDDCPGNASPWVCNQCSAVVEYGLDDGNIYCNCGMSKSSSCTFKCLKPVSMFKDINLLEAALETLNSPQTYTILLLGETNVGKSTWINAFANYLTYPTLDAAVGAKDLITLIPNEFTHTNEENECITIRIGPKSADEDFTAGHSSTQQCKVHRFPFGSTVIRIIDTPGVGDVRGAKRDEQNFQDVLDTISSFDKINAILILLKPNQAVLTLTFRYCIEELLNHLDRSAKDNFIFGFTNSRGTSYRPGETMPALKNHLQARANDIKCSKDTVYCFDSEGYRCLAELLHGIEYDEDILDSYKKSWNYSVKEVIRLFNYIENLKPHDTKRTLSVNNARMLILQLAKPMAQVTSMLLKNVDLLKIEKDRIRNISDKTELFEDDLMFYMVGLQRQDLRYPRTVCTNQACITIETSSDQSVVFYPECHDHCYLNGVTVEVINNLALRGCSVMDGSGTCCRCSHSYKEHMHTTSQYNQINIMVENSGVCDMIDRNASTRDIKDQAIKNLKNLIVELEDEHAQIERIAARFGVFLEKNSITLCNDARAEYLRFLINEQKRLAPEFRDENLIRQLGISLETYQEEVNKLKRAMKFGDTSQCPDLSMVEASIKQLYSLKHSGPTIKGVGESAINATTRTKREVSHRIPLSKTKELDAAKCLAAKIMSSGKDHIKSKYLGIR